MSSFLSPRLFHIRFQRLSVPEKITICSLFALFVLIGTQAASIEESALQPQGNSVDAMLEPMDSQSDSETALASETANDPLNSPYPIPWPWIVDVQSSSVSLSEPQIRYYRSQALLSPDQKYAAYSRIQMEVSPHAVGHHVHSMLFLENLETGDLEFVTASSPYVRNPNIDASSYGQPGMITVLLPVAWSESSDRLLIRGFDSMFGTDLASDYAIVWKRLDHSMRAIAPDNLHYSNAVLLGWSQSNPDNVLFRAGQLGIEQWPMVAVNMNNVAIAAIEDEPVAYGQMTDNFWNGPQARINAEN